eukprot:4316182-Amphidinium_carterae.1
MVVGDQRVMGFWDPHSTDVILTTSPDHYPEWSLAVHIAAGEVLEYKLIGMHGKSVRWEEGENRKLAVGCSSMTVALTFNAPGEDIAQVFLEESLPASSEPDPEELDHVILPPDDLPLMMAEELLPFSEKEEPCVEPMTDSVLLAAQLAMMAPEEADLVAKEGEENRFAVMAPEEAPEEAHPPEAPCEIEDEKIVIPLKQCVQKRPWISPFPCFAGLWKRFTH